VEEAAKQNTEAVALAAPGRMLAAYGDLLAALDRAARVLHAMGIGPGDPVAVALGNAASLFWSFLATAISHAPFSRWGMIRPAASAYPSTAAPNDTALLLHTSGTTSRPKLVRLTNANLCHSAHTIQHSPWAGKTMRLRALCRLQSEVSADDSENAARQSKSRALRR
jgi:acyl-coenzyme A synthetase/AMP-(fatty) acid ligase